MELLLTQGEFIESSADLGVIFVFKETKDSHPHIESVDRSFNGYLSTFVKQEKFEGTLGERLLIPTFGHLRMKKICLIGLGEKKLFKSDVIRRAGGFLIKAVKESKSKTVAVSGSSFFSSDEERSAQMLGEGILSALYDFRDHFGIGDGKKKRVVVDRIALIESENKKIKAIQKGLDRAEVLNEAVVLARDLVNRSPRHVRPMDLAETAKQIASKGRGITCRIIDRDEMHRLGMGGALAVGEGSVYPPVCIHLTYRPKKKTKKKIVLIGKGVTFDSGGLSLKPADSMSLMKTDMAGSADVIGLFQVLPALDVHAEVHGVCIAVENMPSGNAYRPGDVVRAMNGMTIEIANTDAEGRVTLADAISYAVKKIKPDHIIDIATLTGAAITALGDDCAVFMSNDRELAKSLARASKRAGELFWELPLIAHYDEALQSKVADVNNSGGKSGGAIKGGLFLQRFVNKISWAHLDIAGPAFCEKEYRPDLCYGATGFGIRTLVELLEEKE
jgi:leucyl aminopeptidase